MAQIWKVRLPDGRVLRPTEWSSTPLWTVVEVASGPITSRLQGFSYGKGGEVPGSVGPRKATLVDTNFNGDGGQLQENEELLVFSIMVELYMRVPDPTSYFDGGDPGVPDPPNVGLQNVLRFQRDTLLALRIADTKPYVEHPVGFFPSSMGIHHYMGSARNVNPAAPVNSAALVGTNGSPASFDNRKLATPHHVQPGEALSLDLEFPFGGVIGAGGTDPLNFGADDEARLMVRMYLDGYRRRPVA